MSTPAPAPWRPTIAHVRAVTVATVCGAIAVVVGRPDLLVVATPFAIVAAWSTATKPARVPSLVDRFGNPTLREGDATTWHVDVADIGPDLADFVTASVPATPWLETMPETGAVTSPVVSGTTPHAAVAVRSTRWGRRTIEPSEVTAVGHWGAFVWSTRTPVRSLHTLPLPVAFDTAAPARPSDGLVGLYRSARRGEGGEFAAIRPFVAGDRMPRINWPRSLRGGELLVNATWADQDTHIKLVIDAGADYGVSEGIDGRASSLDTAVRAAGAIAAHSTGRGDRVSLRTFGTGAHQVVAAGSGAAHLRRMLDTLTRVRAAQGPSGGVPGRPRQPFADDDAQLTVMLSPLISRAALDHAVALGRRGLSVVVIDTLPSDVATHDDPYAALAWRIRLLERRREIRRVQQVGVPVVRWHGPLSLVQFLRDVARRADAPRLRVR